jgi:hypothetical protein
MSNNYYVFLVGFFTGAAIEMTKNHLTIRDISFYKVYTEKNLRVELEEFKKGLDEREQRVVKSIQKLTEVNNGPATT